MVSQKGVLERQFENLKGSEFRACLDRKYFCEGKLYSGHFLTKVSEGGCNINFSLCILYVMRQILLALQFDYSKM